MRQGCRVPAREHCQQQQCASSSSSGGGSPQPSALQHEGKAVFDQIQHGEAPARVTPVVVQLAHLGRCSGGRGTRKTCAQQTDLVNVTAHLYPDASTPPERGNPAASDIKVKTPPFPRMNTHLHNISHTGTRHHTTTHLSIICHLPSLKGSPDAVPQPRTQLIQPCRQSSAPRAHKVPTGIQPRRGPVPCAGAAAACRAVKGPKRDVEAHDALPAFAAKVVTQLLEHFPARGRSNIGQQTRLMK